MESIGKHYRGRIVVNPLLSSVRIEDIAPQSIQTFIACLITRKSFCASFIYGLYSIVDRKPLWDSLILIGSIMYQPWLILGDFSTVYSIQEINMGRRKLRPMKFVIFLIVV